MQLHDVEYVGMSDSLAGVIEYVCGSKKCSQAVLHSVARIVRDRLIIPMCAHGNMRFDPTTGNDDMFFNSDGDVKRVQYGSPLYRVLKTKIMSMPEMGLDFGGLVGAYKGISEEEDKKGVEKMDNPLLSRTRFEKR